MKGAADMFTAVDLAVVHSQAFNGGGLRSRGWNPSVDGSEIGILTSGTIAKRQGVAPPSIDCDCAQCEIARPKAVCFADADMRAACGRFTPYKSQHPAQATCSDCVASDSFAAALEWLSGR